MGATTSDLNFLLNSGPIGIDIAGRDWSQHSMEAIGNWPSSLRAALSTALSAGFPSFVAWGENFHTFYNAAYKPILGSKITLGQGLPLAELWSEIADVVRTMAQDAFSGAAQYFEDRPFVLDRHGYSEHAYFTFCFSPIRDEYGAIGGILGTLIETTEKVAALANYRDSDERYRLALEASGNIGTWVVNPETNMGFLDERLRRCSMLISRLRKTAPPSKSLPSVFIRKIAGRLRRRLQKPFVRESDTTSITVSFNDPARSSGSLRRESYSLT